MLGYPPSGLEREGDGAMDGIWVDYAGMNAAEIAIWLLIATAVGFLARMIVRGRVILGLWGDAAIGLIAIFAVGTIMRALDFNLANWIADAVPSVADFSLWLDIAISGFIGSLLIRVVLKPFT
jgi:uncharacterized membrane protein YeaQ/YmgE (transglycosylase-associated protein family)